jgi:hypothetical protein
MYFIKLSLNKQNRLSDRLVHAVKMFKFRKPK